MATTYLTGQGSNVRGSYSMDLAQNDSHVFEVAMDVSFMLIELVFIDTTGIGTVYTSLDSLDKIRTMTVEGDETDITWTKWSSGDITELTSDKRGEDYAPTAIKFSNISTGDTDIRFNFRGIYGGK